MIFRRIGELPNIKIYNVGSSIIGVKKPHLGRKGTVLHAIGHVYIVKWDDGSESHAYSHEISECHSKEN
jgi:hypothetical protein